MDPTNLPFDPVLARQVRADSLEPRQQPTPRGFQTATDYRQQVMVKHPYLSKFHSYAEYLHAGLLEGDPHVISYVPQPFQLKIRGEYYPPDCYVVRDNGPRQVVELKPRGEMAADRRLPVWHYLAQYGLEFVVLSNESVEDRATEAENWLEIVRNLYLARDLDTSLAEYAVLETVQSAAACTLADLVDPGDREHTYGREIALFRLLHRGWLQADLTRQPLDWSLEVWRCD